MKWRTGVVTALLLVGSAAAYADDVEQNRRIIGRLYDELFSKWNLAVIDELISPEFIGHEMPPDMPRGPEGVRQFYAGIRAGLPDVRLTPEDMIAEGDKVVVRWRARATHQGPFLGIPPTGASVSFTGVAIYRLSSGKVVERWAEVGLLGLAEQLRAAAASPAAAPSPPQDNRAPDREQVEVIIRQWEEAWNDHDMRAFGSLFHEDGTWILWTGQVWKGRAAIEEGTAAVHKTVFRNSVQRERVEELTFVGPDAAIVRFYSTLTGDERSPGKVVRSRKFLVVTRRDGAWKVAWGQNTRLADNAPD